MPPETRTSEKLLMGLAVAALVALCMGAWWLACEAWDAMRAMWP